MKIPTIFTLAAILIVLLLNKPWSYFPLFSFAKSPAPISKSTPKTKKTTPTNTVSQAPFATNAPMSNQKILKDVGEAYMDNFGLTDADFQNMNNAGITIIEGNFDICATDEDVNYFLSKSAQYGIKVIMPAGSGEAEWGYACDEDPYSASQKPVWQKNMVTSFINKWKGNPAVYAWDTSNEAGSVLPNASSYMLTLSQLQTAYGDVKNADPRHPVMIRMNGWFFYDNDKDFFPAGNPFSAGVADIVMVNAYSNVEDYYPDFVRTVMRRAQTTISQIDPHVAYSAALGVWSEPPLWVLPTVEHLNHDAYASKNGKAPAIIAFFKYGAKDSEWYLPKDAPQLWKEISNL